MQVVITGLLTNYQTAGRGRDILLLHGWGDNLQTFDVLSRGLAKKHRVTSLDLPGFGATEPPQEVWGLEDYGAFIASFIEKVGLRSYDLVAHSNGGAVAIRAVSHGLLKPDKLILLASAGIRDRHKVRRLALKIIAKAGKVATFWLPVKSKRKLKQKLYGAVGSDLNVAPHLQETFKKTVRQDVQADASRLDLPVLLLYGSDDIATPPEFGDIFVNLIKGAKIELVKGAGHFVHHDKPAQTLRSIEGFLND